MADMPVPEIGREGPLSGIKVVDLTRVLSGPFCTMLLADMGADVIKIETPGKGDPVRGQGDVVDGLSWYFAAFNRNKRSLALDLRAPEGKAILEQLIEDADVLVENYRPGILDKMGLTKERLGALNPRLVTTSVNGFGSTGPYRDRPAFDFIAQAMSGFMAVNGVEGQDPMRTAPPIADLIAGLYGAFGTVAALHGVTRSGGGQHVEAAMVNGLVSMFAFVSAGYFTRGVQPLRTGNDHPVAAPYGLFHTGSGEIAVAPANDKILAKFLEVLGLSEILDDSRYATNPERVKRRAELRIMVEAKLEADDAATWIDRLNAAGVPCGRVQSLAEVFEDDPQIRDQEMVLEVEHPGYGEVRMTGFPVKMDETPCVVRRPAPRLGEHTDEVLSALGYDADTIREFRQRRIV